MSTHNICFCEEIKKKYYRYLDTPSYLKLSGAMHFIDIYCFCDFPVGTYCKKNKKIESLLLMAISLFWEF